MTTLHDYFSLETETVVLKEYDNQLMNRKEIRVILRNAAGNLKKSNAIEMFAKRYGTDIKKIVPIRMRCTQGNTDVDASFHVYESAEVIRYMVPRFRTLRILPKLERKKIIDDEKAARIKAKQAAIEKSKPGR
jgi:small subunit ribosomal protein S24e